MCAFSCILWFYKSLQSTSVSSVILNFLKKKHTFMAVDIPLWQLLLCIFSLIFSLFILGMYGDKKLEERVDNTKTESKKKLKRKSRRRKKKSNKVAQIRGERDKYDAVTDTDEDNFLSGKDQMIKDIRQDFERNQVKKYGDLSSPMRIQSHDVEAQEDYSASNGPDWTEAKRKRPFRKVKSFKLFKKCRFTIDQDGLVLKTPYCELDIPANAVHEAIEVLLFPTFYKKYISDDDLLVLLTPCVHMYSPSGDFVFERPVTVSLCTNFSAIRKKEPLNVEIQKEGSGGNWKTFRTLKHDSEAFLSFQCTSFSKYRGVTSKVQTHEMKRSIKFSMHAKSSGDIVHLYCCIHEDKPSACQNLRCEMGAYEEVLAQQCISLKLNANLKVELSSHDDCAWLEIDPKSDVLHSDQLEGENINRKIQFTLKKRGSIGNNGLTAKVNYTVIQISDQGRFYRFDKTPKYFTFQWDHLKKLERRNSQTRQPIYIEASGEQSVGLQVFPQH